MDTIVTAGGVPRPKDPLYEYTQGKNKALLTLAGKPMVQWLLDALGGSLNVDRVWIIGLPENSDLSCKKPLFFISDQGSMLGNIAAGARKVQELTPAAQKVLVASSDIPTITTKVVDWVITEADRSDHDVYYTVITRKVMETRFPGSRRTFIHFKDMEICGGDIALIRPGLAGRESDLWHRISAARKSVFKQAALLGYDTLFLLLLRLLTLEGAVQRASKALKVSGKALVSPYAELGMDVDKPFQFDILHADLKQRAGL
jgi:GTP:adenosylcobinamide-phosphate guanylyltransferase